MGHADAGRLAANLYAKAVKRRAKLSGVYLAEFDRALASASLPTAERALRALAPVTRAVNSPTYTQIWLRQGIRRLGGVVTQRPAKPFTPVRFR
jgi:hypothetical protein